MSENPVVHMARVTKNFSGHTAVKDLELNIPEGAIYGLLGRNGAGKTTTIRMIMNIILPDLGTVRVFGREGDGVGRGRGIGYLPEERGLYQKMQVMDLLQFMAEIKGVSAPIARRRADAWLERMKLSDWRDKRIDSLSKGMQQKIQFISTVLPDPQLIILDEPFSGLDPVNTQMIKDIVLELARSGKTILFSTHIMDHAEKLCDSVCIIDHGEKKADGTVASLRKQHTGRHVVVSVEQQVDGIRDLFTDKKLVKKADEYGRYAELEMTKEADPQKVLLELIRLGARISKFEIAEPTLHKIFVDLVGSDAKEGDQREDTRVA
ncbi:MAG: ATP-binding cassette domain-containing protein [Myxococcota bacterium]|nr:ATP-binding cassette domain-containing protein [Myxococcota bacterium]